MGQLEQRKCRLYDKNKTRVFCMILYHSIVVAETHSVLLYTSRRQRTNMPSLKQIDDSKTRPNDDASTTAASTSVRANNHKRKRPSNEKQECRGSIVVHARPASRIERTLNDSSINFSSVPVASQSSLAHGNIQNRWNDNKQNFIFSSFDLEASNRSAEGSHHEAAKGQVSFLIWSCMKFNRTMISEPYLSTETLNNNRHKMICRMPNIYLAP